MTRRLVLSYLGLAVLILLILEAPLAALAQRFEQSLATNQVGRDANGLVAVVDDDLEQQQTAQLQTVVASYESRTGAEISVVTTALKVIAASSDDADDDATGEWIGLTRRALAGQSASAFTSDEGRPFAVASVPILSDDGTLIGAVVLGTPATFTENRIHDIWLALGIFAVVALVVATIAGALLARSVARPLGELEASLGRFGHGDLSSRARAAKGPPEIRSLARQFNQMADRLDDLVEAQKRFVADASHQLRSPLTALRLRIENLEAGADEQTSGAIAAVGRELQRLSRIVDGLLTLSRTSEDQPEPEELDLAGVIADRCDAWSALAAERGVQLVQEHRLGRFDAVPLIAGDIDQIIDNLLANAVEVSPPGGRIVVRLVTPKPDRFEVHVVDQGPGMSAGDRQRAFDRFWQGADRRSGHSGLGLAIVRQLAQRNSLTVELRESSPHGLDAVISGDMRR